MDYKSALERATILLGHKNVSPDEALPLVAQSLGVDTATILSHPERELNTEDKKQFERNLLMRCAGYSLAATVGYKFFYGLKFFVSEDTLIPRPETELLVDQALRYTSGLDHGAILDMGTGCGNIIISLATYANNTSQFDYYAADIAPRTLAYAKKNAGLHRVKIHPILTNLFSNIPHRPFSLIAANLPYLSTKQLSEPSIRKEPLGSLWGGSTGTDVYQEFLKQAPLFLADSALVLMEIDPEQKNELMTLASETFPHAAITCIKDLSDNDRVLKIELTAV